MSCQSIVHLEHSLMYHVLTVIISKFIDLKKEYHSQDQTIELIILILHDRQACVLH